LRKQYHFRRVGPDVHIWDVDRLVELSRNLVTENVPLAAIREIDEPYWFQPTGDEPTCRRVLEHARLALEADLSFPIILSAEGWVMDGMHRVGRALLFGHTEIRAVRFKIDPEPDFINKNSDELPY
jgi:hypothetical protein